MTPTQLRAYLAVVRHGSTKGAAAELGVSEAAVSSHTAALRRELDDELFRRGGGGLRFTPGGIRLATRAAEILGLQDRTVEEVAAASEGRRLLRLATTALFAEYAAPGLIELFRTRSADLEVELAVRAGASFPDLLAGRLSDVTIGPAQVSTGASVQRVEFLRYQLVVVAAPTHPLANRRAGPEDLRAVEWHLGPSAVEDGVTVAILRRFAVPEDRQRVYQSHAEAQAEVEAGAGIGVVPEFRARPATVDGRLARVDGRGLDATGLWTASARADSDADSAASELLRFVSTPRAIQAMLGGSGAAAGRFKPFLHVTLWS